MKTLPALVVVLLLSTNLSLAGPNRDDIPRPVRDDCTMDSECRPMPEIHRACSHYCADKNECAKAPLCNAFRPDPSVPLPLCAANTPCRRPTRVWCDKGICRTE